MAYSSIPRKKCKCGCGRYPTLSCKGYNFNCVPDELKEQVGTRRKVQIRNQNARKAISVKIRADNRKKVEYSEETVKEAWFKARRREMTGFCQEEGCRNRTNRESDTYFRWSVCHIVPKSLVSSVAYHPLNWIELCWQHHSEFDATFDKAAKMNCFAEAKRKFELFKHLIPPEELRKINPHLFTIHT